MGLRVGTNINALNAIRNLNAVDSKLSDNNGRLSSGLRIRSAADDPSGLVISEGLRAQINSLQVAEKTVTRASNILSTAESSLATAADMLLRIREQIVTAQGDSSAVQASQGTIDSLLSSIDSLGRNAKFGGMSLLDGSSSIAVTSKSNVTGVSILSANFGTKASITYNVSISQKASAAYLTFTNSSFTLTSGGPSFLVTTQEGSVTISLASGPYTAGASVIAANFASGTSSIGVFASGDSLYTVSTGGDAFISITQLSSAGTISGSFTATSDRTFSSVTLGAGSSVGNSVAGSGQNFAGTVGGFSAGGTGYSLEVATSTFTGSIYLDPEAVTTSTSANFVLKKGGLTFQLGGSTADQLNLAMPTLNTAKLGFDSFTRGGSGETVGGYLSDLRAGGTMDLSSDEFENSIRIVDFSLDQLTLARARLGGIQANTVDTRADQLSIEISNLSAVASSITDVDFASEISDFTKNQVLFQSAISTLAAANAQSTAVLSLLGG
ncbi:MAG: flagellin [Planctomycetes bacterium]|nr:flagellin [Planctomycetota bacterium]